jgi:glycosyltransferase involved in cell wall biosynthesis
MRILVNEFCGHAFQIELSRELARRGHEVLHVYFADNQSTPKGDIQSAERDSANFAIEGLHIPMKFSKHSILTRRKADIAYGNAVAARVLHFRPHIVISANTPLDAQRIVQESTGRQDAKFVFWLQDVYSFAVRFVLMRRFRLLAGIVGSYYEGLEKKLLRKSDGVICIAPAFAAIVADWGVKSSRIFTIENWAPLGEVLPTPKDNPWAHEQGVAEKFCFMYSGTLGMKHRPELLLALARSLETCGDANLIVIASGAGSDWLRANAQTVPANVLSILPFQPYKRLSEVMGASDVLIALLDADAGSFAVPSKVLSYLCAGRPLLVAAPSENQAAQIVKRAEAGVVISPDSATEFVNAARGLMAGKEERARQAANARAFAEESFDIGRIADRFLDVFSEIGNARKTDADPAVSMKYSE